MDLSDRTISTVILAGGFVFDFGPTNNHGLPKWQVGSFWNRRFGFICLGLSHWRSRPAVFAPQGRQLIARGASPWNLRRLSDLFRPGGATVNSQGRKPLEPVQAV